MKNISIRLMIALLTFATGLAAFYFWSFLSSPRPNTPNLRQAVYTVARFPQSSKYGNPAIVDGLYSVERRSGIYIIDPEDQYDGRALVLSLGGKPAKHQANNPDASTPPGFYLSSEVRLDFERVEVTGNRLYFKTSSVGGVSYEFSGISGEGIIPDSHSSMRVNFIKGILKRLSYGEVMTQEEIKFHRAGEG